MTLTLFFSRAAPDPLEALLQLLVVASLEELSAGVARHVPEELWVHGVLGPAERPASLGLADQHGEDADAHPGRYLGRLLRVHLVDHVGVEGIDITIVFDLSSTVRSSAPDGVYTAGSERAFGFATGLHRMRVRVYISTAAWRSLGTERARTVYAADDSPRLAPRDPAQAVRGRRGADGGRGASSGRRNRTSSWPLSERASVLGPLGDAPLQLGLTAERPSGIPQGWCVRALPDEQAA
jgi:hypothetical protein